MLHNEHMPAQKVVHAPRVHPVRTTPIRIPAGNLARSIKLIHQREVEIRNARKSGEEREDQAQSDVVANRSTVVSMQGAGYIDCRGS